jgi:hypothetical protein
MTRNTSVCFFAFGSLALFGLCFLVWEIAGGPGIILGLCLALVLLWSAKKYGWLDTMSVCGFLFTCLAVMLGGMYLLAHYWSVVAGIFWLSGCMICLAVFRRPLQKWVWPIGHIAEVFAEEIVGPIPFRREFPAGCLIAGVGGVLLFFFLMIWGINGIVMWTAQMFLINRYRKLYRKDGRLTLRRSLSCIAFSILLQIVLYISLQAIGFEDIFTADAKSLPFSRIA